MSTSLILMSKLVSMMAMACLGILIVRVGLVSTEDSRAFSALTVYVLQPALIFSSFHLELTAQRRNGFFAAVAVSMLIYVFWILLTGLLKKPFRLDSVDRATLIYSNVGNLTLPVIAMTLSEEMVFYAAALQIPFNLFIWTHGSTVISGKSNYNFKKILLNSNVIAMFLGVLFMLSGLPLPDVVDTTLITLKNAVPSLSMIVVGMVIGRKSLKKLFSNGKAYLIVFGRLIVFPLAAMLLLYLSGFLRRFPEYVPVFQAVFMGLCAPPASTVSQLAVLYDEKPVEASVYNTVGMFLCILTIPLMNLLYEVLF